MVQRCIRANELDPFSELIPLPLPFNELFWIFLRSFTNFHAFKYDVSLFIEFTLNFIHLHQLRKLFFRIKADTVSGPGACHSHELHNVLILNIKSIFELVDLNVFFSWWLSARFTIVKLLKFVFHILSFALFVIFLIQPLKVRCSAWPSLAELLILDRRFSPLNWVTPFLFVNWIPFFCFLNRISFLLLGFWSKISETWRLDVFAGINIQFKFL